MKKKITKEEYLLNPCGTLSIPYYKYLDISDDVLLKIEIIHNNQKDINKKASRFFRLKHDLKNIDLDDNKEIETINVSNDDSLIELIQMINECYKNQGISITKDYLINLINNKVYNENLWIWIKKDGKIIASGIAEYDDSMKEGSLEWIQVLEEYQHQGYGKKIVIDLLRRLKLINAQFCTVSGDLDNKNNPESLYRKCGFFGNDIWYIYKK